MTNFDRLLKTFNNEMRFLLLIYNGHPYDHGCEVNNIFTLRFLNYYIATIKLPHFYNR